MSFGLAGVAGVNPLFFLVEVLLILAWRNARYFGLDRYVLPALGTPWRPGKLFQRAPHGPHRFRPSLNPGKSPKPRYTLQLPRRQDSSSGARSARFGEPKRFDEGGRKAVR